MLGASLLFRLDLIITSLTSIDSTLMLQVTGSSDKTIRQWDVTTGQCVLTMDILWALSNAPSSTANSNFALADPYGASTPGGVFSGHSLLSAVTSGDFRVPTPPYEDGSWEMYDDFVGGVQFWGYALASGSGDGGVRMWDSAYFYTKTPPPAWKIDTLVLLVAR